MPRESSTEPGRVLAEAIPKAALALILSTIVYAVGDLLVPGYVELELTYYFVALLIPIGTLLLHSLTSISARLNIVATDLVWTLVVALGLFAPNATVSGTAFVLSMKWLASALLVPWPVELQLLSTGVGLLLYFTGLVTTPRLDHLYVHQWALPPLAAGLSIIGSRILNRSREQAEVHSTLAAVGQTLISTLDRPLVLEKLCQSMREALHADLSHVILLDPDADAFVPVAGAGDTPEAWEALKVLRFARSRMPDFLSRLQNKELLEVSPALNSDLLPAGLQAAYGISAGLFVALRRGDEMIGALTAGYRQPTTGFTAHQRRIARGIGHLASLALENSRLVEELDAANRVKSNFVATMSHELRTPLNVLIGYQDLLLDAEFGLLTPDQQEIVRRLAFHARQLLVLVNDTLDLSRLESGKMQIETRAIHLPSFIERLRKEAEEAWGNRGLALSFDVRGEPVLLGDSPKLHVILRSLIANAVKFTESGSVRVAVVRNDGGVEFTVADTGIGIPAEALSLIFEPFTQAAPSIATRFGGAGLGLHIVKRLLDMLGGKVAVRSTVGEGSTFTVWVPDQTSEPNDQR